MQTEHKTRVENAQERFFGRRYIGASLSTIKIPSGSSERISKWMSNPKGFLILTGPAGVGKTYFCAALLECVPNNVHSMRAYNERNLLKRVREQISNKKDGEYIEFLHLLIDDDLIFLDDIGSSGHTTWREEILMEAIDYRYSNEKPTIITSNLGRKEFYETYGQRIASRLFARENTVIDLGESPDLRSQGL